LSNFPWELRIVHEGNAGLILERSGRRFRFDPVGSVESDDVVILTGADPGAAAVVRLRGARDVVRPIEHGEVSTSIDGVLIEGVPYAPPIDDSAVVRLGAAARKIGGTARKLVRRRETIPAMIWQLTFEDGSRLVHLGRSIHGQTDAGWAADVVTRFGQPKWLLVGAPYGQDQSVFERTPAMEAEHVLVMDLEGDLRRMNGRPTALITPLVDRLEAKGVPVMVFVPQSSVRFE
jgi:hypothetical protein